MVVINRDAQFLEDIKTLESYILSESNIITLTTSQDKRKYGVQLKAEPDFRLLGMNILFPNYKFVIRRPSEVRSKESHRLSQGPFTIPLTISFYMFRMM